MKRKLIISVIIGTLIASSIVLTGCGNSNNTETNTQASQSQSINQNDSNSTQNNDKATEDSQTKDNNTQENNSSSNKGTSNSDENSEKATETKDSQNAKSNASSSKDSNNNNNNNNDSSNSSDKKDSNSSQENTEDNKSNSNNKEENKSKVPLKELADKIADLELGGNVQYITPVKAIGSGENLSYEEDPNSNLFFCSDTKFDSKNLKYGTLVNLFGYNEKTDTYSFIVSSYEFLKNGGSGTIDHGTISSTGKIESGNLN